MFEIISIIPTIKIMCEIEISLIIQICQHKTSTHTCINTHTHTLSIEHTQQLADCSQVCLAHATIEKTNEIKPNDQEPLIHN